METATHDGFTVESNDSTADELAAEIQPAAADVVVPVARIETLPEADSAAATEVKPVAKPRSNPQARVEQATGDAATARREAADARRERDELRARLDALERPKPAEPQKETKQSEWQRYKSMPGAPQLADFDGPEQYEDWTTARSLFVAEKRFEELRDIERQSEAKTASEASEMEHYTKFQTRLSEAAGDDPGAFFAQFDPRLTETPRLSMLKPGETPTFGNWLAEQIYRSDAPIEKLLEHFTNTAEVQRLATLHPMQAIREFARIEARLTPAAASPSSGPAPRVKTASQAKPPIRPERGSAQVGSDEPPGDDATDAEHEAFYSKFRAKYR